MRSEEKKPHPVNGGESLLKFRLVLQPPRDWTAVICWERALGWRIWLLLISCPAVSQLCVSVSSSAKWGFWSQSPRSVTALTPGAYRGPGQHWCPKDKFRAHQGRKKSTVKVKSSISYIEIQTLGGCCRRFLKLKKKNSMALSLPIGTATEPVSGLHPGHLFRPHWFPAPSFLSHRMF